MKLKIHNFQSVQNAELDFENSGITLIVGESNNGKSAILRSIKSLLTNKQGKDFITWGHGNCDITLDNVTWNKGKDIFYLVKDQKFERLGSNVPEEVYKSLNMFPLDLEGYEIFLNFNEQFDSPFLLIDSPSKIAKLFGYFTSIETLYSAIQRCNKDVKSVQQEIQYSQKRQDEIENLLDSLPNIENLLELYEEIVLLSKYNDLKDNIISLDVNYFDIEEISLLREYTSLYKKTSTVQVPEALDLGVLDTLRSYSFLNKQTDSFTVPESPQIPFVELLRGYLTAKEHCDSLEKELSDEGIDLAICPVCNKEF